MFDRFQISSLLEVGPAWEEMDKLNQETKTCGQNTSRDVRPSVVTLDRKAQGKSNQLIQR